MTVIGHGLISFALAQTSISWIKQKWSLLQNKTLSWGLVALAVSLGTINDWSAAIQGLFGGPRWTGIYSWLHNPENVWYIPFTNIHAFMDKPWHKATGGWVWWGSIAEYLFWLLVVVLLYGYLLNKYWCKDEVADKRQDTEVDTKRTLREPESFTGVSFNKRTKGIRSAGRVD
jgi:hypothetical protein